MRFIACFASCALVSASEAAHYSVQLTCHAGPTIAGIVDTGSDSFRITSWTDSSPVPVFRVPMASQLPLTLRAFTETGSLFDVPDTWTGDVGVTAGWAFLLPIGQDLTTVQWIGGQPISYWRKASFGWGSLRNAWGKNVLKDRATFCYVPGASDDRVYGVTLDQINVMPVPESATVLLLALGGCVGLRRRWRR